MSDLPSLLAAARSKLASADADLVAAQALITPVPTPTPPPTPTPTPSPSPPTTNPLNTGLLGYYESSAISGNVMPDLSGHSAHATFTSTPDVTAAGVQLRPNSATLARGDGAQFSWTGDTTMVAVFTPDDPADHGEEPVRIIFIKSGAGYYCWQYRGRFGSRRVDSLGQPWWDADSPPFVAGENVCATFYKAPSSATATDGTLQSWANGTAGELLTGFAGVMRSEAAGAVGWTDPTSCFSGRLRTILVYRGILPNDLLALIRSGSRPDSAIVPPVPTPTPTPTPAPTPSPPPPTTGLVAEPFPTPAPGAAVVAPTFP